ncbi:hypothetical protein [Aquipuribacter sp. SD81]|uniref:hypothetical protein n=1 Tax=Aquipuribacter sp. SD81 TaxID=3127703 RepID=UPI003017AF70
MHRRPLGAAAALAVLVASLVVPGVSRDAEAPEGAPVAAASYAGPGRGGSSGAAATPSVGDDRALALRSGTGTGAGGADAVVVAAGGPGGDRSERPAPGDAGPAPAAGPPVVPPPAVPGPVAATPAAAPATAPASPAPSTTPTAPTTPTTPGNSVPTAPAPFREAAPGTVTGTLVRVWVDGDGAGHDDAHLPETWLEGEDGTAYRVEPTAVADAPEGARVTARLGSRAGADLPHPVTAVERVEEPVLAAGAVEFGEGSTDVFGAAAATLEHEVTVVLAYPAKGTRDGTTTATLTDVVGRGANTYWQQQTRGQRGFRVVRAVGWTSFASPCSEAFDVWNEVAAKVGWTGGTRRHLLLYIPSANGCGSGLGTVGSSPDSGGRAWVGTPMPSIVAHELGHNLGLGHANGLLCTDRSDGTYASGAWQSGCSHHEYRNYYDVMGVSWSNLGSLAAPNADALGVLRSTERLVTSEPVRVHLVPQTGEGLRVLRIDEGAATYYVEYRVASGWDAWLGSNSRGLDAGVVVTRRSPVSARQSVLLDGSVTSGTRTSDWASALRRGTTLRTASGATTITVEQQSDSGATVVVTREGRSPDAVTVPAGGRQVELRAPSISTASVGTTVFAGVGSAPEGTLLWEVVQNGTVRASGTAVTGANGQFDTFNVPVALPAGTYTFRVRVPDESDGEADGVLDPALLVDQTTVTVR